MNEHLCQLSLTKEIKFPFMNIKPFTFMNVWTTWCGISKYTPKSDIYMDSMATIAAEKLRHSESKYWWIIHPFSYARFLWDTFMMIIFMISFFTIPFMVCIIMDYETIRLDLVNVPIYVICWLDIMLNCITGYYNKKTMTIELKPVEVFKFYLQKFFILDVLSSFPYDYMTLQWRRLPGNNPNYIITLINIMPLLKLTRYCTFSSNIYYLFQYFKTDLFYLDLCTTLLLGLYLIFWFTCLCYVIPILLMYFMNIPQEECRECWMTKLVDKSIHFRFINAAFIVVKNMLGSDYGPFIPETDGLIIFETVLMIIGRLIMCYILIMFLQIKAQRKLFESKFHELIDQVKAYSRQKQLLPHMKKRLLAYYHYRFKNSYFRSKRILSDLTEPLREEIAFQSCRRLIENVAIFKTLSKDILQSIVKNLIFELYLPNDVIIKAGSQGDCMFFLSTGTVAIFTPTGKEICHLNDGAYFGEIALLVADQRRMASVIAIDICEVYRLDRKDFRQCIDIHSELFEKIERIASERIERTTRAEEQYKRFLMRPTTISNANDKISKT